MITLRGWIGFGAGSSYFDATIEVSDASGKALAEMTIDKNSWPLGGILASAQTTGKFMQAAAEYFPTELKAAKMRGPRPPNR